MDTKSSLILLLCLIVAILSIAFSLDENNQLKSNVLNLERELQSTNTKMNIINYENKILNKEIENVREDKPEWKEFFITGYTANSGEQGTNHIVATMFNLNLKRVRNLPIIAVDPKIIPLYSIVEIKDLGIFIALDVGGLIKGNRIDILCSDVETAYGITGTYSVRVLEKGMTLVK